MNCSLVGRPATLKNRIPSERFTPADFCCGCGLRVVLTAWTFTLACTLAAARILRNGRLAGHSCSPLYALDLSFLFGCPINLFHLLLSCVPSSKQLARTIARRGSEVNNKSWRE